MSRPPPELPAQKSANAASSAPLSVTSTTRVQSPAPNSKLSAARPSSLRSTAPTRQPLPWNSLTPSRPIPLPAPVMNIVFIDLISAQPLSLLRPHLLCDAASSSCLVCCDVYVGSLQTPCTR